LHTRSLGCRKSAGSRPFTRIPQRKAGPSRSLYVSFSPALVYSRNLMAIVSFSFAGENQEEPRDLCPVAGRDSCRVGKVLRVVQPGSGWAGSGPFTKSSQVNPVPTSGTSGEFAALRRIVGIAGGSIVGSTFHSRVLRRQARRNREKFDSVIVERLKCCSVLVALVDSLTNGMPSKSLTVGSTTKLPTLFPAVERRTGIRRSVKKWGQQHVAAARTNNDRSRFGG
jgi:hypothetical protein